MPKADCFRTYPDACWKGLKAGFIRQPSASTGVVDRTANGVQVVKPDLYADDTPADLFIPSTSARAYHPPNPATPSPDLTLSDEEGVLEDDARQSGKTYLLSADHAHGRKAEAITSSSSSIIKVNGRT